MKEIAIILLEVYKTIAFETGCLTRLVNPENTPESKMAVLQQRIDTHGFVRANLVGSDGISPIDGLNVAEREYFKKSMTGLTWVSEPTISKVTGQAVIMISAPVWKNGDPFSKEVVGIIYYTKDAQALTDIVNRIKIGEGGITYLLDKNGNVIAHPDNNYSSMASYEAEMVKGGEGFKEYSINGEDRFAAYAPLGNPGGWSVAVTTSKDETGVLSNATKATVDKMNIYIGAIDNALLEMASH